MISIDFFLAGIKSDAVSFQNAYHNAWNLMIFSKKNTHISIHWKSMKENVELKTNTNKLFEITCRSQSSHSFNIFNSIELCNMGFGEHHCNKSKKIVYFQWTRMTPWRSSTSWSMTFHFQ